MSVAAERVTIRSYRSVLDQVERRIFHLDRWRLPTPHGVSVRALLYTLSAAAAVAVASQLPLLGAALALVPASALYVGVPLVVGWALASWQIDGRAPHHALRAVVRYALAPKSLAGVRRCPAAGVELAPLAAIEIAPSGDEASYRAGRVRGPATLVLRYPARVRAERGREVADARRLRLAPIAGGRAMPVGRRVEVAAGREVVFDG